MAQRVEPHPLEAALAALLANGLDGAGEALRILVNEASKIERAEFLNARPHERTSARTDYAHGFKPKTVMTRLGEQTFDIPQVRGGFYPPALEKGSRTEQALNLALSEGFTVFERPHAQRTRLRTTNGLERINREIKRRTRVASIFPNTASCLRFVAALLAECDEEWMTGKVYLNLHA